VIGKNFIMRRMRWAGQAACMRMSKNQNRDLVRKFEGKTTWKT
jgi:hypothetical protein